MEPDPRFLGRAPSFWAYVRAISQTLGYTQSGLVSTYSEAAVRMALDRLGLESATLSERDGSGNTFAEALVGYFAHRADILNGYVEPRLMDATRAQTVFESQLTVHAPRYPVPLNKQSGEKKRPAYLTGLVNMTIESAIEGLPCDYDPRSLPLFTDHGRLLYTLSRRVDGCFPNCLDPIAVWEVKEYYYTTTFGSRIADGVYETLLDGFELQEAKRLGHPGAMHLLVIDGHQTWWAQGKSYLCRLIDLLHMSYVDEVLFGYEVVERLALIARRWADRYRSINH